MKQNLIANNNEVDVVHFLISSKVKFLRLKNNFSQLEVATLMGFTSPSFYSHAESSTNKKIFNVEHLYLLAKIFNVEVAEIVPKKEEIERTLLKNSNNILSK